MGACRAPMWSGCGRWCDAEMTEMTEIAGWGIRRVIIPEIVWLIGRFTSLAWRRLTNLNRTDSANLLKKTMIRVSVQTESSWETEMRRRVVDEYRPELPKWLETSQNATYSSNNRRRIS